MQTHRIEVDASLQEVVKQGGGFQRPHSIDDN